MITKTLLNLIGVKEALVMKYERLCRLAKNKKERGRFVSPKFRKYRSKVIKYRDELENLIGKL